VSDLAVVLRSSAQPAIAPAVVRAAAWPHVRRVITVSDRSFDRGMTPALVSAAPTRVPVEALSLDPYGWSRALNAALDALVASGSSWTHVLVVSLEAVVGDDDVLAMVAAASEGASCAFVRFVDRPERSYRGPRNTCCLWRRSTFDVVGRFDETLDEAGGMEDYELAARAWVETRLEARFAGRRVPVAIRDPRGFGAKLRAEDTALDRIGSRWPARSIDAFHAITDETARASRSPTRPPR
jgi:hypothetical protein